MADDVDFFLGKWTVSYPATPPTDQIFQAGSPIEITRTGGKLGIVHTPPSGKPEDAVIDLREHRIPVSNEVVLIGNLMWEHPHEGEHPPQIEHPKEPLVLWIQEREADGGIVGTYFPLKSQLSGQGDNQPLLYHKGVWHGDP